MNSVSAAAIEAMEFGPGQARQDGARWLLRECAGMPFSIEAAGWLVDGAGTWRLVISLGDEPRCGPGVAYACIAEMMIRKPPQPWHADEASLTLRDVVVAEAVLPMICGVSSRGVGYAAG